jgi:hypothetical protein
MLSTTSPGFSTSVCGIIGSCSGSVYSWMSRSCWTMRSGSERKGHWAPTDARNSWDAWCVSVEDRGHLGVGHGDFGIEGGELQVLLMLLRAVMAARERQDQGIVPL